MTQKLNIYGISDLEMDRMRQAADLAWRGIRYPEPRRSIQAVPHQAAAPQWGRVNNAETELQRYYAAEV